MWKYRFWINMVGKREIKTQERKKNKTIGTEEGTPIQKFLDEHSLDHNSRRLHFFEAFWRIFHGLSPSPRMEMKFDNQTKDPVNGNDFISNSLRPNARRRHKHFRCFLAVQNPVTPSKPRSANLTGRSKSFYVIFWQLV